MRGAIPAHTEKRRDAFTGCAQGNCMKLTPPLIMDDRDREFAVSTLSRSLPKAPPLMI
jgi:4-aminobutyrate aminotransferase-like enzyme